MKQTKIKCPLCKSRADIILENYKYMVNCITCGYYNRLKNAGKLYQEQLKQKTYAKIPSPRTM